MPTIQHENKIHEAACNLSEGTRQNAVAAAIRAGGSGSTVGAAVRTAEIAHYRRVIASCVVNGLPFKEFAGALKDLGTDGT
jgi:hypothetical protein